MAGEAVAGAADAPAPRGLSEAEAEARLRRDGANELPHGRGGGAWALLLESAGEPMILLLVACGSVYLLLGDRGEGLAMLASVLVIIGISLYQTRRTERALAALRELASPRARVLRDGVERSIAASGLVRGDLVRLVEGDRVPADGVVVATAHLALDESILTGESVPVRKTAGRDDAPTEGARPGGDDTPWLFAATLVVAGQALMRVAATGARTEVGRIGRSLASAVQLDTPLERQVASVVRIVGGLGLLLCLLVAAAYGLARGSWLEGALAGLALAMALMPEEFPVILTLFLAFGAWRIARRRVLIRRMPALEALGATTVLCVDKTGTLTENRMRLAAVLGDGTRWDPPVGAPEAAPESVHRVLEFAVLASRETSFDPTEHAIQALCTRALSDTEHLHRTWTLAREYPLSPELLAMSQVWRSVDAAPRDGDAAAERRWAVAAKGAPEAIIDLCHLPADRQQAIQAAVGALAAEGLRVLAVAAAQVRAAALPPQQHDFAFEFLGLLGLADPVRETVPAAVAACRRAGLRVVMITGDYPATARAIAAGLGLGTRVMTGAELDALDDAALAARIGSVDAFARVTPEQKLRIVQAFGAAGEVVAMSGDGVNDAPALHAATIGIAMGRRGTEVAREAADLVLMDDDFASIASAIRLGRRIYDNIRKAMRYVVAVHVPIAGVALAPVLLDWPLVLLPLHIVLLELIVDPACSIAFESEPEEADVMSRPPRPSGERLLDARAVATALLQGGLALLVLCGLLAAVTAAGYSAERARTVTFAALVVANLALILTSRSRAAGAALLDRRNRALWTVLGAASVGLAAILWLAPLRTLLRLAPPSSSDLALIAAAGAVMLIGFELLKLMIARVAR
ncbi:MAG: cation-translocating P-type ATPase [Deltaproteobacteria bacterium]|nr:cation-translocating P-type ATPase [Deltaproteobacteria bacterium]